MALSDDLAHAQLLAPVSGVVLQPPDSDSSSKRSDLVAVGSRVSKGQAVLSIGNLETMSVRAKVDEIDVNKVRVGQPVVITGDALDDMELNGTVTTIAAQASGESAARSGMAAFAVTVEIRHLTPDQRARVHVGMSASLSIVAYDKPDAIVVPGQRAALHGYQAHRQRAARRSGRGGTRHDRDHDARRRGSPQRPQAR